jgi:hypothetical protein
MDYNTQINGEIGWDDTITQDPEEFPILPEGDYQFIVEKFERSRFNGSENIPACNQAKLTIKVFNQQVETHIVHTLLLHTKTEWALSQFFTAIGQKKKGEPLRMDWNRVIGASGKCKVIIKKYNGNDYNNISKFYPLENQQMNYSPYNQYTHGKF